MDEVVLLPSVGLAVLLIAIYLVRCYRRHLQYDQSTLINIVLNASGMVCGGFLIGASCFPQVMEKLSGINLYVFIGGLAVVAVSSQGLFKDVFRSQLSTAPHGEPQGQLIGSFAVNESKDAPSDVV